MDVGEIEERFIARSGQNDSRGWFVLGSYAGRGKRRPYNGKKLSED
jgi:hypothetical protein